MPKQLTITLLVVFTSLARADDVSFRRILVDEAGPQNPWIKIAGDFDGDGQVDIAIGGSKGPLVWYAAPSWEKRTVAASGYSAVDGEAADMDGDGDLDIVMGGVLWYENPGSPREAGSEGWTAHRIGRHNAHDVEVADLNGDGKLDVVTRDQSGFGHNDGNRILVWSRRAPETWKSLEIRSPHGEGLALGDLDRDGDPDIVIGARWFENESGGTEWKEHVYSKSWDRGDVKVALGDLNGDGRLDVALSPAEPRGESYRIAWYEAPESPRDTNWQERIIATEVETVVHALGVADVTGDGKPDVVSAEMHQGSDPDEVVVHVNGSEGKSWRRQVISTRGSHNILLVDMDADGDVDIVGANHGGSFQPIEMWENLRVAGVFEPGAEPELVLEKGAGEGPAWHPTLGLFFSGSNRITRLDRTGETHVVRDPSGSNGLLFDREGRLIVCEPGARRVSRIDPGDLDTSADDSLTVLTDAFEGRRYNTPNDVTVDSRGRIYFSDPRYGNREGLEILDDKGKPVEGVYRIDPDGTVSRVIAHEVDRPNGLLVSRDDRYLFVADNNNNTVGGARRLWRFDLKESGTVDPASRELVFDWETGRGPDGMVQDAEGRLYVAAGLDRPHPPAETAGKFKGGVYVLTPDGQLLDFVAIPRDEVTNCTFGGADLRTLYVTAGGTLWRIRTRARGWLPWPED